MARAPCLSSESTSSDVRNSVEEVVEMSGVCTGPTIADVIWLYSEPNSKASLARCLTQLYEFQEERGAAPLPNFDEFLVALGRPRWEWTPQASTLFHRISRIILDFRRSNPVQVTQPLHEIMQRRRAALRRRNRSRPIGRETSEATVPTTETEGSARRCVEWSEVS